MAIEEIQRLQDDLTTMRQVMRLDKLPLRSSGGKLAMMWGPRTAVS